MGDAVGVGVAGGAGGTEAVTEDLEAAAGWVAEASALLDEAATHLDRSSDLLDEARPRAAAEVAGALARADAAVGTARWGVGGVSTLAREVDDVAHRLVAVAQAYARAEGEARGGLAVLESVRRFAGDAAATVGWLTQLGAVVRWKMSVPGVVATLSGRDRVAATLAPAAPPPMTGYINRGTVGATAGALQATGPPWMRHYDAAILALRGVMTTGELMAGEPRIAGATRVGVADVAPPRGMEGIAAGLDDLELPPAGVVAIDRLDGPEGTAYVVTIPGTYDNGVSSINPFDWGGNGDVMAGAVSDAMRMVRAAMLEEGIAPDAPVMLVGHSQGGLVATALAGLEDMHERFAITDVVTFGAPTATLPRRSDVTYAHVEDVSDVVPALDGPANPEGPNVTTWTGDARASGDASVAAAATGVVSVHGMSTYRATASAVDRLADPSTRAWRTRARPFLTASSAQRSLFAPVAVGSARAPVSASGTPTISRDSRP
ncbi:hypothetical protein [Demequina sp. NBRC 110055]|uniref:PGAP1-like alpha/beta domain-containing protein n=1 Tax=Demequina sp. NBRC 110055 TaxID=1570344 RepID=UPI0009FF4A3D|nr:hypothetical protein [Demequina sp. NBRC 110055]